MYNGLVLEATYRSATAVREELVRRDTTEAKAEVTAEDVLGIITLLFGFSQALRDLWTQLESRLGKGAEIGGFVLIADRVAQTMALWLDGAAIIQRWGTQVDPRKRTEKTVSALQSLAAGEKDLAQTLLTVNRIRELARIHKPHPPAEAIEKALQGRELTSGEVRTLIGKKA
jgi:hypothetical protein